MQTRPIKALSEQHGRLLGFVPNYILLPMLAALLLISALKVWRHE
jgi:hypothetical protein